MVGAKSLSREVLSLLPSPKKTAGMDQDGPYPASTRQNDDKVSFLDLPGELQNEIYLVVLEDSGAYLTKRLRVAMPTSLSLVSKQVHAQMLGQAMHCVTARVQDFNFDKIITFLNRLPEEDVSLLKTKTKTREREAVVKIELVLTSNLLPSRVLLPPKLARWLNRFNVPTKRAPGLKITYTWPKYIDFAIMSRLHQSFESRNAGLLTGAGKEQMRKVHDGMKLRWVNQHETLVETVKAFSCTCGMPSVSGSYFTRDWACEFCRMSADVRNFRPSTWGVGQ